MFAFDRTTGHSALFLETRVKVESAAWSLRRLLEALEGTAAAPAPAGVAAVWRWEVAVDLPFRFATANHLADRLAELAVASRPADYWERHRASVDSLSGSRIQEVARAFSVGREAIAVVGDAEVLEPQLRAAGFKVELLQTPSGSCRGDAGRGARRAGVASLPDASADSAAPDRGSGVNCVSQVSGGGSP